MQRFIVIVINRCYYAATADTETFLKDPTYNVVAEIALHFFPQFEPVLNVNS